MISAEIALTQSKSSQCKFPRAGPPISLLERGAKKTCEKGRNLEPRNAHFHAFRGNFSSGYPRDKGCNLEPRNPRVHAFIGVTYHQVIRVIRVFVWHE